ncbi:MAG: asparagine synthase-related protein [Acidobacteriota bacterium]|nr:asparagine synthase-related protein [Acidobacteriota bacterium]
MSVIFGFTGNRDDTLAAGMQRILAHRSKGPWLAHSAPWGTLYHGAPPKWSGEHGGLIHDGPQTLAMAGFLTDHGLPDSNAPFLARLLAAYRAEGEDALTRLRGAFVLALLDGERLILVRDGAGARSLYTTVFKNRVFFAVEPKALWSLPGFSRDIRPAAPARYLTYSFQPTHETMLRDIEAVLPGHLICFEADGSKRSTRFFRFEEYEPEEVDPAVTREDWIERFRNHFQAAITERMAPGEPIGAFLSGGIDSSAVVAELARQAPGRVTTFAVHFGPDYKHELDFARAVAEQCGTDHHEVLLKPRDFLPELRRIIWLLDDPIGDPVTVPNFALARHVAPMLNGVFNGEGGDPVFGGPKNIPMMMLHWYGGSRDPLYLEHAYLASYRRAYDELTHILTPEFREQLDLDAALAGPLTPFFKAQKPRLLLNQLMSINIRLKGGRLILPKVERMLGANGLVPLSPLFDERLIELGFALPPHLKLAAGVEKIIIKEAYRDLLPESVIERPKSGMRVPVYFWFQGEMRRYARKILSKRALRKSPVFNHERVKQLLSYEIEEGRGRYGIKLWMLITFEIWRRLVIEGEPI